MDIVLCKRTFCKKKKNRFSRMHERSCGISFYGKYNDCGDSDSPFAPHSHETLQIHTLCNTLILSTATTLKS